jgi:hypothetical protein
MARHRNGYQDEAEQYVARLAASLIRRRNFLKWCAAFGTGTLITQVAACTQSASSGGGSPAASGSASPAAGSGKDLPVTIAMSELVEKAKAEGQLHAYGMPGDWANWKGCFDALSKNYGIKSIYEPEGGLSSAEEVQKFLAEVNNPVGDIADVGILFGPEAKSQRCRRTLGF